MTDVFDGMAGVMAEIFGAPVLYTPEGGVEQSVHALLRLAPIEVAGGDGHPVLILSPTLQVPRNVLPGIERGDRVALAATPTENYAVLNRLPSGSPAGDAMLICELERVDV